MTTTPPTVQQVLDAYLASPAFRELAASSRESYPRVLRRWLQRTAIADRTLADVTSDDIERYCDGLSPGAAHTDFKRIRVLWRWAMAKPRRYVKEDITEGLRYPPVNQQHHTWTDDEIAAYRQRWRLGTRERLCLELGLNTSQRLGDLARMRWEHVTPAGIVVRQEKTKRDLVVPVLPDLQEALDAWPGSRCGAILQRVERPRGRALTKESLGTLFAGWCDAAGLPDRCVLHGLRHACLTRLANAGCSVFELQSFSGHATLTMLAHYTKKADQLRLARSAAEKARAGLGLGR
jgi:integrase